MQTFSPREAELLCEKKPIFGVLPKVISSFGIRTIKGLSPIVPEVHNGWRLVRVWG